MTLPRFYPVLDSADWIARVLPLGVRLVQLRAKDRPEGDLRDQIARARDLCRKHGAILVVNGGGSLKRALVGDNLAKLAIDNAITSYCHAYGLGATSLRYFNVAGAYNGIGENHLTETHLIPIVLQVAMGYRDKILIYGDDWPTKDGTCVRDYIHVRDLADAHILALEANTAGTHHIFNLGSGDGYSVREVIEVCRDVTGHPIPSEVAPRRAGDPATLIASSGTIRRELGWDPTRTQLRTIVRDAWEFTRQLGDRSHSAR